MKPELKVISAKSKGEVYALDREKISIGREAANEIALNDASVSRRHCLLEKRGEEYFIRDLESLNGTRVNGEQILETKLAYGDRIGVGDFTLRFQTADFTEDTSSVILDKTEFRLPKNSVQMRIEDVFGEMARDLTAILQIISKINALRDTEDLQSELLRQIFEVVPADEGAILLVDDDLEITESVGLDRAAESDSVAVSQTVIERVLREKKVILVSDLAQDAAGELQAAESLFLAKTSSLVCAPMTLFGKAFGAIYLSSARANFDEGHLRFLTAAAGIAAAAIENAGNFARLKTENERLRGESLGRNMIGDSDAMRKVYSVIERAAPADSTVLITGESGTGKELAAQAIHLNSSRRDRPFVAINCAALTETLLESELFGHEKGAFTGAIQQKKGKIELAGGGTLFLDEIGETALNLQAKLLRVLQEREFERVGGGKTIKADIRLVAATNRDLAAEIKAGRFRQDLFYRLNVVSFEMPALRARKDDIPLLADHFTDKYSRAVGRHLRGISAKAKRLLLAYDYPGNVRELENAVERAVVLGAGEWILPEDLPEDFLDVKIEDESGALSSYHDAVREKKKDLILDAFRKSRGSYVETAKLLDIHPNYLHRLIRNLDMKDELESSI